MTTVLLLIISNIFMTLAWYGHLQFKDKPLWLMIGNPGAARRDRASEQRSQPVGGGLTRSSLHDFARDRVYPE